MKLYVDDDKEYRPTPEGWDRVYNAKDAYEILATEEVTHLSLDHDLGSPNDDTGYDIMKWIEMRVEMEGFPLPDIKFHTANPTGRINMQATLDAILRRQRK